MALRFFRPSPRRRFRPALWSMAGTAFQCSIARRRGAAASISASFPHLQHLGGITPGDPDDIRKLATRGGAMDKAPFRSPIEDFYLTNPIARASAVMAECSALAERAAATAAE